MVVSPGNCSPSQPHAEAAISGWGVSNAVLAALPKLEVISFTGLGASTFIDIAEAGRKNITVTHTLSSA
jgi:D-3-phosphoglycerate dehydrogenase